MQTRYIHFVKFSGQAAQTVAFMEFCVETQTLEGILTAIYLVLTLEILPAGAGQGEEDFSAEKRTCVNLAFIEASWTSKQIVPPPSPHTHTHPEVYSHT